MSSDFKGNNGNMKEFSKIWKNIISNLEIYFQPLYHVCE